MAEIDLGIEGLSDYGVVGSGGFATVYSAYEAEADRTVAVKVFTSFDDRARRQFDRERRTMGPTTQHPNIVTMLRSGYTVPEARPFLVLEHMGRGSLQDRLDASGPMPLGEAVEVVVLVAEALGFAHSSGIVHKDVKPENILVDRFGVVKLADFGIAEIKEATAASQVALSLAYAPPEAFAADVGPDGGVVDPRDERSDLYSLGVTLYSLVVGSVPFGAVNSAALMNQILSSSVPSVADSGLDGFFAVALAKDPGDRYQTSAAFVAAVRELAAVGSAGKASEGTDESVKDFGEVVDESDETLAFKGFRSDQPTEVAAGGGSVHGQKTEVADTGNLLVSDERVKPNLGKVSLMAGGLVAAVVVVGGLVWAASSDGNSETALPTTTTSQQQPASPTTTADPNTTNPDAPTTVNPDTTTDNPETTAAGSDLSAEEYVERGDAHAAAGEFDEAIEDYDNAVNLDPTNALAYGGRGWAYLKLEQYDSAIEDLDEAIALDATNLAALVNRGATHRRLNNFEQAIEDLDKAVSLYPNSGEAVFNRGLVYSSSGEYERAIEDYDRSIALGPNAKSAFQNRGLAYSSLGETKRAIEDFDQAIAIDSNYALAFANRSASYRKLGEDELELADLVEALRLVDSGQASISLSASDIQLARGRVEELSS